MQDENNPGQRKVPPIPKQIASDADLAQLKAIEGVSVLPNPCAPEALLAEIRRVLALLPDQEHPLE